MAYTKTNWVNGTTPITQTNLNKIEDELYDLDTGKLNKQYRSNSLSSQGWYRIARFNKTDAPQYGTSIVRLCQVWNNNPPQTITMIINNTSDLNEIVILSSTARTTITKARLVQDTVDEKNYIFLEIFYNQNVANNIITEIFDGSNYAQVIPYTATTEDTGTVKFSVNVAKYNLNEVIGTLSSLTTSDKTSLVNALNELRLQTRSATDGLYLATTSLLTNRTFDDVMSLNYPTIFTINGDSNIVSGAGFPTGAYEFGALITLYSSVFYAKMQIYITDNPNEEGGRGIYIRARVGGTWTKLTSTQKITTGTEYSTNEYIDGKRVYRKIFDLGELNATTKFVNTNIDPTKVVSITGGGYSASGGYIPFFYRSSETNGLFSIQINSSKQFYINTTINFTKIIADVRYFK